MLELVGHSTFPQAEMKAGFLCLNKKVNLNMSQGIHLCFKLPKQTEFEKK